MASLNKRIPREVGDAQAETMRAAGIYYWADEANLRSGRAMIIGPPDTPYEGCPLVFQFALPGNYPFDPPAVQILTSDGTTRFHPNLYVQGKVCLSILGTWTGPKWSAVMTISTVLSSIQSLLEANPLTNEPGYEKFTLEDARAKGYAEFVEARLMAHTFADLCRWRKGICPPLWEEFRDVLAEIGISLWEKMFARIQAKAAAGEQTWASIPYAMSGSSRWKALKLLGEQTLAEIGAAP
jgi:ubiquitin-protein ligase